MRSSSASRIVIVGDARITRLSRQSPGLQAAEILKVRRATLSDLLHGKAALTPKMALRIEKAFGPDMNHLLRMQLALRRRADPAALQGHWHQEVCPRLKGSPEPADSPGRAAKLLALPAEFLPPFYLGDTFDRR
jgi:plasmid maintenance system antidote protein VapI